MNRAAISSGVSVASRGTHSHEGALCDPAIRQGRTIFVETQRVGSRLATTALNGDALNLMSYSTEHSAALHYHHTYPLTAGHTYHIPLPSIGSRLGRLTKRLAQQLPVIAVSRPQVHQR